MVSLYTFELATIFLQLLQTFYLYRNFMNLVRIFKSANYFKLTQGCNSAWYRRTFNLSEHFRIGRYICSGLAIQLNEASISAATIGSDKKCAAIMTFEITVKFCEGRNINILSYTNLFSTHIPHAFVSAI